MQKCSTLPPGKRTFPQKLESQGNNRAATFFYLFIFFFTVLVISTLKINLFLFLHATEKKLALIIKDLRAVNILELIRLKLHKQLRVQGSKEYSVSAGSSI